MKFTIRLLFLLSLSSCITESLPEGPSGSKLQVGSMIPDFSIVMSDGSLVSKSSLTGKQALITFFHTQCSDCQKELPVLNQVYLEHQNDTSRQFICISRSEPEAAVSKYWKQHQLSLPYAATTDDQVYRLFAYNTVPLIYIVDRNGIIQAIYTDRPLATQEDLEQWIDH